MRACACMRDATSEWVMTRRPCLFTLLNITHTQEPELPYARQTYLKGNTGSNTKHVTVHIARLGLGSQSTRKNVIEGQQVVGYPVLHGSVIPTPEIQQASVILREEHQVCCALRTATKKIHQVVVDKYWHRSPFSLLVNSGLRVGNRPCAARVW
jgi:hypothetical protein